MRFLVVEDAPIARKLLSIHLSELGECDVACDGAEGVEAFRAALESGRPYDLICLDIMMPGMDGHRTLKEIRAIEEDTGILGLDGVKVIMTTALDDSTNVLGAFSEGCEAYMVKPIRKDQLIVEMQKLGVTLDVTQS